VRNEIHLSNLGDSIIRAETFIENNALKKAIESDGSNIFVKNLPQTITPKQLFDLAQTYGKIISIKLKQDKQGKSLGYGYVQYSSNEEASMAIECLNKITIQGKYILAEKFEKDRSKLDQNPQENKSNVLYIDQIPSRVLFDLNSRSLMIKNLKKSSVFLER
jgi:RNA recognition motif-containing protein